MSLLISINFKTSTRLSYNIVTRFLSDESSRRFYNAAVFSISFPLDNPTLFPTNSKNRTDKGGNLFPVFNPAASCEQLFDISKKKVTMAKTEFSIEPHNFQQSLAMVESVDSSMISSIIQTSSSILASWRDETTALHRSKILQQLSHLIHINRDDLANIMTLESGKPLHESYAEIQYASSYIDFYAGETIRPTSAGGGFLIPTPFQNLQGKPKGTLMAIQQAVGVTAMITPWNFPLAMITRKVAPALAVGCTTIVKPSDLTPLTALALQTLAQEAGLPSGVMQVIPVSKEETASVGLELCTNPLVRKISFTGSTSVGKLLLQQASDTVKRMSLELGGNAPFIVFEDADIDQAVQAATLSKFRNAGQTCVCADRFIIHESIEDIFIDKLKERVCKIKVGPGLLKETTMGPLISSAAMNRVWTKVQDALSCRETSVELVYGGSPMPQLGPNYFEPTILRNVSPSSHLWKSETFGPVVPITTFKYDEEALELANREKEGLAAYFCTRDLSRIFRFASR